PVAVVTKTRLSENNSRYAQGGIAAVVPSNTEDSIAAHVADTLSAGAGRCKPDSVETILREGAMAIDDLLKAGVIFDGSDMTHPHLAKEAAHSHHRILHAGGDATGQTIEQALISRAEALGDAIVAMEFTAVQALLTSLRSPSSCIGALVQDMRTGELKTILAPATVLASGGIGRLFAQTTNPTIATGDGLALAYQAGASLSDLAFIQFHPTAFYHQGRVRFLVSEALRGEGATLINALGEPFAKRGHPDGELAPRDIVTRLIFKEMQASEQSHVFLDARHLQGLPVNERFPTITAACRRLGVDPITMPIPVAPAAHYAMGGVTVTPDATTNISGLWAVGEVACSGLHGANRLASNSLLECVVLARHAASGIAQLLQRDSHALNCQGQDNAFAHRISLEDIDWRMLPDYLKCQTPLILAAGIRSEINQRLHRLYQLMWQEVGIVRSPKGLQRALSTIENWQQDCTDWVLSFGGIHHRFTALMQQLEVCRLITQQAIEEPVSVGAHYLEESPLSVSLLACV
ncbi:MAG: FAD-binding protein, partial [Vampirovibrionales bacterium]|nr:FAD-binding protein [Vampirovibrionales bacterium]